MSRPILNRFLFFSLIGILLAIAINEITFLFLKSEAGRAPGRVELLIPAGTADKIARGEAQSALPANMVFVTGDVLVVKNEDNITHTLGPLFIPPGASAEMSLDNAENLAMSCSFQPTKYLGLDIREPVDWGTRLFALFISGIPLGLVLALYSFLVWPVKAVISE
ncbi:MAG: hypothetical protein Fur0035_16210 [Anaerolineales bacterium]